LCVPATAPTSTCTAPRSSVPCWTKLWNGATTSPPPGASKSTAGDSSTECWAACTRPRDSAHMAGSRAPSHPQRWQKVSTWETVQVEDRRMCATCRTVVRSYTYRFHPADSPFYERCIWLSWCSGCRVYTGAMVHVPRDQVLPDALASLRPEEREQLKASEIRLVE